MVRQTTLIAFSTLTFEAGEIPTGFENSFKEFVNKKSVACIAVRESGRHGSNSHYHMYIVLKNATGTDTLTRSLRGLYPRELGTNRYTVLTKIEKDPIYRIGCYFTKESDSEIIIRNNIDLEFYKSEWIKRKTLSTTLIKQKNNIRYTVNQLPSVYVAYCDTKELQWDQFEYNFASMYRDGYIQVTQLKQLKYVKVAIEMMKGANLPVNLIQLIS